MSDRFPQPRPFGFSLAKTLIKALSLALLLSATLAWAQDNKDSRVYYLFLSGKLSVQVKKEFFPVSNFDGKKLHLNGASKPIRPSNNLNCSFSPTAVVSNLYADIGDFEFSVDSSSARLRAMHSINEMNAEQMRFEAANEFESARIFGNQSKTFTQSDKEITALNELTKNQTDDIHHISGLNSRIDNLYGSCSISSDRDIKNAFAAFVITVEHADDPKSSRSTFVRVVPVGDVEASIPEPVKFNCDFPELKAASLKADLFLFDGSGKQVATNHSRGLKQLSAEELEELRQKSAGGSRK